MVRAVARISTSRSIQASCAGENGGSPSAVAGSGVGSSETIVAVSAGRLELREKERETKRKKLSQF